MPPTFWRRRADAHSREQAARRALADVTASRRAVAEAYEVERRRIERDLHDGAQQYLVAALMHLGEAQTSPTLATDPALQSLVSQAKSAVAQSLDALRATVHGIHPQTLTDLGLEAAVREAAGPRARVTCPHSLPPLPEPVMAAAYFVAAEALTNAAKHAPGAHVSVLLAAGADLTVSVVDDGPGGAVLAPGRGLGGMRERVAAFGGSLHVSSPPGGPTQLRAELPLLLDAGQTAVGDVPAPPLDRQEPTP